MEWKVRRRLRWVPGCVSETPACFRRAVPNVRVYLPDQRRDPVTRVTCLPDGCSDCVLPVAGTRLLETLEGRLCHLLCACQCRAESHSRPAAAKSAQEPCSPVRLGRLKPQTAGDLQNDAPGSPCKDRALQVRVREGSPERGTPRLIRATAHSSEGVYLPRHRGPHGSAWWQPEVC